MTIKVFQLDDCDWWAGESLEACIEAGREACGKGCYEDAEAEGYQVSDEAMRTLKIRRDEDSQEPITFETYLAELIAAGEKFPVYFASTEF